jgi:lysophospholipase L1-like esterase
MKSVLKWLGLGVLGLALVAGALFFFYGDKLGSAEFWESEIEAFEASDAKAFPEESLILFTGSSSIRMWSSLEADMAPLAVLNRGFGGAHMDHVLHYYDRVIAPYAARALVLYVGDNDIGAGKTPQIVEDDFRTLVDRVRRDQPEIPIYFLTIKASRLRWDLWAEMDDANQRIVAIATADPLIQVIDVSAPMVELGAGDAPPKSLFLFDGLHLSEEGYALWTSIVRDRLLADLGSD